LKTVLITGAGQGFGFALANIFHKKNYYVYAVVRSEKSKNLLLKRLSNISVLISDVTSSHYKVELEAFLSDVHLNVLINNAGSVGTVGETVETTSEELIHEFNVHCVGALSTVKGTIKHLRRADKPMIINISSRRGSLTMQSKGKAIDSGSPVSYRIAKASQNMLSLCLADDLEKYEISVSSVHPGALLTRMNPPDADVEPDIAAEQLINLLHTGQIKSRDYLCLSSGRLDW